jgi:tRNA uridine 5-carboxymethylaminomethyl modification enzyme
VRLAALVNERKVVLDVDPEFSEHDLATLETTIKYAGYLEQELSRAERARRDDRRRIASHFPFESVPGLSREVVQRLQQIRPETLGQAARIPGMTPAAVAVLDVFLNRLSPPATHT